MNRAKILKIIAAVLTALIVALTAYVVISIVVARSGGRDVELFGYSMGIVLTPSMEPEIMAGDLIVFTHADISEAQVGDDIVFVAGDGFDAAVRGNNVVHRVREVISSDGVTRQLVTYGINNHGDDASPVTADNFVGICIFHSSWLGAFFRFMINYGVLILIAVIALPFIVGQIIKIIRLSRRNDEGGADSEK